MQTSPASVKETLEDQNSCRERDLVEYAKLHGASKDVIR